VRHLLLLGLLGMAALQCNRDEPPVPAAEREGLSDERKAEIRRFWEVYNRATSLRLQGAWAEAVAAYQEALALDPRHEDSLYYLAASLLDEEAPLLSPGCYLQGEVNAFPLLNLPVLDAQERYLLQDTEESLSDLKF